MNTYENMTDPVFADYHELASESPDRAIELLVWMFTDAKLTARRHAFLMGFNADEFAANTSISANELAAIRCSGIFEAIKSGDTSVEAIANAACSSMGLIAVYEAFNAEPAPWIPQPVKLSSPPFLGRTSTMTTSLLGKGTVPELSITVPEGDVIGPSQDRRRLLLRCPVEMMGECPYTIVGIECVTAEGSKFRKAMVVKYNTRADEFQGSISAERLLNGTRAEFSRKDRVQAHRLDTLAGVEAFGIRPEDVSEVLRNDPVASNNPSVSSTLEQLRDAITTPNGGKE